jgi:hypothetical protein
LWYTALSYHLKQQVFIDILEKLLPPSFNLKVVVVDFSKTSVNHLLELLYASAKQLEVVAVTHCPASYRFMSGLVSCSNSANSL